MCSWAGGRCVFARLEIAHKYPSNKEAAMAKLRCLACLDGSLKGQWACVWYYQIHTYKLPRTFNRVGLSAAFLISYIIQYIFPFSHKSSSNELNNRETL